MLRKIYYTSTIYVKQEFIVFFDEILDAHCVVVAPCVEDVVIIVAMVIDFSE